MVSQIVYFNIFDVFYACIIFFNFLRTSSDFLFVRKQKTLKFKKINKESLNSGRILHVLTSHKCFLFVIKIPSFEAQTMSLFLYGCSEHCEL